MVLNVEVKHSETLKHETKILTRKCAKMYESQVEECGEVRRLMVIWKYG